MGKHEKNFSYQEAIGRVVEQLRMDKGWTQCNWYEAIGSSQSAIHRIEKGAAEYFFRIDREVVTSTGATDSFGERHGVAELSNSRRKRAAVKAVINTK